MKVLCIIPPHVPSYFNAGHHLPIFQVAAYLRKNASCTTVQAHDLAALNATWKDVCQILLAGYDVIAVLNDFDGCDSFGRFAEYCQEISPRSKLVTFGRASKQAPRYFERFGFHAISHEGDYEDAIASYVDHLVSGATPRGVLLRNDDLYDECSPGINLPPEQWVFPDVAEIPYGAYDTMYLDDLRKFCGIPGRRELVVPVARGCPIGCSFCDVPTMQGKAERRASVETVCRYIRDAQAKQCFDYVSFYAPTFTLKRSWVIELCRNLTASNFRTPWKCVTTMSTLDQDLVQQMGHAGCVRISVGVETLSPNAVKHMPVAKQSELKQVVNVNEWCSKANIELNCFVIAGLPGDSPRDFEWTVSTLHSLGVRVRPTIYTPYELLPESMSERDFRRLNRQFVCDSALGRVERDTLYHLVHAPPNDQPTRVQEGIPVRPRDAKS